MTRKIDNAFTRSSAAVPMAGGGLSGLDVNGPARPTFQPLRAELARLPQPAPVAAEDDGALADPDSQSVEPIERWSLQVSPMRLVDAVPVWTALGSADDDDDRTFTVVLNAHFVGGVAGRTLPASLAAFAAETVGATAEPHDGCAVVDDGCIVVGDGALGQLVADGRLIGATMVRILGPVEPGDARAIRDAVRAGRPSWSADFRAAAVLEISDDRALALTTESEPLAVALVAENLRQYLAAIRDESLDGIGVPSPRDVHALLTATGSMTVRPVETDCYASFVDIGICTSPDEDTPAGTSMIYDLPTATWHFE